MGEVTVLRHENALSDEEVTELVDLAFDKHGSPQNKTNRPSAKMPPRVLKGPIMLKVNPTSAGEEESHLNSAPKSKERDHLGSRPIEHALTTKGSSRHYHQPPSSRPVQVTDEGDAASVAHHKSLPSLKPDCRPRLSLNIPAKVDNLVTAAILRMDKTAHSSSSGEDGNITTVPSHTSSPLTETSQQRCSSSELLPPIEVDDDETAETTPCTAPVEIDADETFGTNPWTADVEAYATALGQSSLSSTGMDYDLATAMQREMEFDAQLFMPAMHRTRDLLTARRSDGRTLQRARTSLRKRKREESI